MSRPFWACGTMFVVLLLAGCSHPENYRWRGGANPEVSPAPRPPPNSQFEWDNPSVAVYSYATPAPSAQGLTIRDLSDRGQAALVDVMTRAGANPETIRDALARPISANPARPEGAASVEGSYNRTIVATVTKGWSAGPADRLVRTWVDIQPLNFVFDGYTVVATDNQVLNIEQITNTTAGSLQAQLGRTTTDTSATTTTGSPVTNVLTDVLGTSAGATANLSQTRMTTAAINQQYTKLSADITPRELRIYRESERNLDVAGNTLIALTARIDTRLWQRDPRLRPLIDRSQRVTKLALTKTDGSSFAPAEVQIEVAFQESPPRCPLLANVYLLYEMRRVTDNAGSYVEGEQEVRYERNRYDRPRVEIVPADVVRKPSWRVFGSGDRGQAPSIMLRDALGRTLPLDFLSYQQARNFAEWMNRHAALMQGRSSLRIGGAGLELYSGDADVPLPRGPFTAQSLADPDDLARRCQLTEAPEPASE